MLALKIRSLVGRTNKILSLLSGFALVFIMGSIFANVFRRELLDGRSISGVIEYNEIVLTALVFLSLANTQRTRDHVAVDLVTRRLPDRVAWGLRGLGLIVAAIFLAWMGYRALVVGISSYQSGEYRFGLARVPIWPARLLLPFGLTFLVLQVLVHATDDLLGLFTGRRPSVADKEHKGVGL